MYCGQCGALNPDDNNYCVSCGNTLRLTTQESPLVHAPAASAAGVSDVVKSSESIYASFWRRLAAYVIDYFVLMLVTVLTAMALVGFDSDLDNDGDRKAFLALVALLAAPWLYSAFFESSSTQATIGKLALGIKVTDLSGNRVSFGRASGRYFGEILSAVTFGVGYSMAAFTKRRQALHDKLADTLIVRKASVPAEIAAAPPARPVPVWAAVLVVLLCPLPIIGIFAATAIPAYQDYTIRSQVSEGLTIAADYKAGVAEAIAQGMEFDEITSSGLDLPVETESNYVQSIEVVTGAIAITYGRNANRLIQDKVLVVVPAFDQGGELIWNCGYRRSPDGATDVFDEHWNFSDVQEKHLPAACRSQ